LTGDGQPLIVDAKLNSHEQSYGQPGILNSA
jgi:hypothetical protein